MKPGFFPALVFATLASITDFAVGIKDLGLDGAVVITAGSGGISLFFFLVFAQNDEQLLFYNFQIFFQPLKFLPFVAHFVVAVVGVVVLVVELC